MYCLSIKKNLRPIGKDNIKWGIRKAEGILGKCQAQEDSPRT